MQSAHTRVDVGLLWTPLAPIKPVLQAVRLARAMRLDFMLFGDHVQAFTPRSIWDGRLGFWWRPGSSPHDLLEVFTLLGRVSTAAGGLRLGVGVSDVQRRHPIVLAQAAATMSSIARRPFILGLGAGERENTEPYGLDSAPRVARLEEAAQYVRAALTSTGSSFDFSGHFFTADHAVMDQPAAAVGPTAIWIAANGPRMLEVAGRQGDGWLPVFIKDPSDYEQRLRVVQAAAVKAGRPAEAVQPGLELNLMVAPTRREVDRLLESRLARFTGVNTPASLWREHGLVHPLGEDFAGYTDIVPERLEPRLVEEAMRIVPREMVERQFLAGTPNSVIRQLGDLRDAGMRAVCFIPASLHTMRLTLYTFWVMGRIARRLH